MRCFIPFVKRKLLPCRLPPHFSSAASPQPACRERRFAKAAAFQMFAPLTVLLAVYSDSSARGATKVSTSGLCCRNFISGYNRHSISSITRRKHSFETSQITVQMAALRANHYSPVRQMVLQISTILSRFGRDDERARPRSGPYDCLRLRENSAIQYRSLQPNCCGPTAAFLLIWSVDEAAGFHRTASIICRTPRIFNTRLMLYESTVKPISAPTFASPFVRKYPWFIPRFIVPNGCSTNELRSLIF